MIEKDNIYNLDCFLGMKSIPDGSVSLIVTDPPYKVTKPHNGGQMFADKKLYDYQHELDDSNLCDSYDIRLFSREVLRLQDGVNLYVWCNKVQIPEYFKVYVEELHCKFDILCWHKKNALPTFSNKYLCDTEYLLFFHTKGTTKPQNYEDARTYDVGQINHSDKRLYNHPTIKPLHIIQRIIRNSSQPGDLVLDPFLGSGTTAVACKREKRHYIGFEIDKDYYDMACRRVRQDTPELKLF